MKGFGLKCVCHSIYSKSMAEAKFRAEIETEGILFNLGKMESDIAMAFSGVAFSLVGAESSLRIVNTPVWLGM